MDDLIASIETFFQIAESQTLRFYNEAELQHELGYWLRSTMPSGTRVFFERKASTFFPAAPRLAKTEIDLVMTAPGKPGPIAIELKCPRSKRVPDTMYDACTDLQFLEQLNAVGFCGGVFVMHVDDPDFYSNGKQTGIYAHFRKGVPLPATLSSPTATAKPDVNLAGQYRVNWQTYGANSRCWVQEVLTSAALQATRR